MNAAGRIQGGVASPLAALLLVGGGVSAAAIALSATPAAAAPIHVSTEAAFLTAWDSNANDTIILDADIHLSVATCDDADRESVSAPITIDGQGQFKIVQDCAGQRVLTATNLAGDITLRGVTITGGSNTGDGAGLDDTSTAVVTVTVDHSTFINNVIGGNSGADGGGINMSAGAGSTLIVNASSFLNNHATDDGGAIDCNDDSTITVTGSTFAGNSTRAGSGNSGAAIDMESSNCFLTMTNSTVTSNTSGDEGVLNAENSSDTIKLVYSSIVNNAVSPATPGVQAAPVAPSSDEPGRPAHADVRASAVATANVEISTPANLTVFGSVIARPHGGPNCSDSNGVALTGVVSAGYNFADDTSCGLTAATDKQAAGLDPLVGPLASNGGPTQTVLPQTGSPLIDAIPAAACQTGPAAGVTTDQRGLARPQGPGCDIGAVELAVVTALVVVPRFTG